MDISNDKLKELLVEPGHISEADFKTALFAASGYVIQDLLTLQEPAPYYYTSYLETAKKADMLLKEEVKPHLSYSHLPYR